MISINKVDIILDVYNDPGWFSRQLKCKLKNLPSRADQQVYLMLVLEMMKDQKAPTATLNDGNEMPLIGLGTSSVWGQKPGDQGYDAIKAAIECGYRFIDTAAVYGNEEAVGAVVKECIDKGIVKREELYICTKVWCTSHKRASVLKSCKQSLKRLQMTYVDLYLVHWPTSYAEGLDPVTPKDPVTKKILYGDTHITETWQGMEDCKDAGLVRSIGVSNFNHKMTDEIIALPCKYKPTTNQVECHPYLTQDKLLEYSKGVGIVLIAYCPLGSPGASQQPGQPVLLEDPVIIELSKKYSKTPAQIVNHFHIQRKVCTIPKSVNLARIKENIDCLDFELSKEDMEKLASLNRNLRYCLNTAGEYVTDHPNYPFHIEY